MIRTVGAPPRHGARSRIKRPCHRIGIRDTSRTLEARSGDTVIVRTTRPSREAGLRSSRRFRSVPRDGVAPRRRSPPSPWGVRCRQGRPGLFLAFELRPGTFGIKFFLCGTVDVAGQLTGGLRIGSRGDRPDPVSPFLHALRGFRILTHTTFVPFCGLLRLPCRSVRRGRAAVWTTGRPRRRRSAGNRATSASEGVAVMATTPRCTPFAESGPGLPKVHIPKPGADQPDH